jgi:hypothetical protein
MNGRRVGRLAAVLLLGAACTTTFDSGPVPRLAPPAWRDGERAVYFASRGDSLLYQTTVSISLDEEADPGPGEGPAVPTVEVTSVTEALEDGQYFFDSGVVIFRRADIVPLHSRRTVETELSDFDIETRYARTRAFIRKETVDGVTDQTLELPPNTFSNDISQTLLRSVPPTPGLVFRINLLVPMEFRTLPARVQVLGTKLIETGLGDIICREISVLTPGRETRHWVELAEPRRYIGMRDMLSETQAVIVEYTPAHADSLPAPATP